MEQVLIQVQLACFIAGLSVLGLGILVCGVRSEWRASPEKEEK